LEIACFNEKKENDINMALPKHTEFNSWSFRCNGNGWNLSKYAFANDLYNWDGSYIVGIAEQDGMSVLPLTSPPKIKASLTIFLLNLCTFVLKYRLN
jgi:hypothetical protein